MSFFFICLITVFLQKVNYNLVVFVFLQLFSEFLHNTYVKLATNRAFFFCQSSENFIDNAIRSLLIEAIA
jgi:hypothetical protein